MGLYIGTKLIKARAMTRLQYNQLRGWEVPSDENPDDKGYLVEYVDGGKPNHPDFAGYISWSPIDVFERAYQPTSGMDFGMALNAMKAGKRVARSGWNGKGMWLSLVKPYTEAIRSAGAPCICYRGFGLPQGSAGDATKLPELLPYIGMKTADDKFVPWLASQTDMLATDWYIVE